MGLERHLLTGSMFRSMIYGAANQLDQEKKEIDFLNVYPVPDGDTGTNMALTLMAAAQEVGRCISESVGELAAAAAKGSLMGARGNSGVILSQLFRGFAQVMQGKHMATVHDLSRGLQEASAMAYKAVMRPVEGTMLTVSRMAAEAGKSVAKRESDVVLWFAAVLEAAEKALAETEKMLPALAAAGVVDAGGQGVVTIYSGMYAALIQSEVPVLAEVAAVSTVPGGAPILEMGPLEDIKFRYCTELIVLGAVALDKLRRELEPLGDSLLVVGDSNATKIHVHTNHPGQVLEICGTYGEMSAIDIDNMAEQNQEAHLPVESAKSNGLANALPSTIAVGTDAIEQAKRKMGMVAVSLGDGFKSIFQGLGVDVVLNGGQTMNPSTKELVAAIEQVPAESVIVLPNNKNVLFAAEQAAKMATKEVVVIPTYDLPRGVAAATVYDEKLELTELTKRMQKASEGLVSGAVTYSVRNTTTDGVQINEQDFIGLEQGKVVVAGNELIHTTKELVRSLLAKRKADLVSLFYGKDVIKAAAKDLVQQLRAEFPEPEWELYEGGQPLYYYLVAVE